MKILVTGSEGNVGKTLVAYLQSKGHLIFGIDIVQRFTENYKVTDITHPLELSEVFRTFQPDVCYHLAAIVSRVICEDSPTLTIHANVAGTNNVVQLCRIHNVRLIYFSTSEIYGNIDGLLTEDRSDISPNNIYGVSKLMGEQLVRYNLTYGLNAIIVRPFMMYREGEKTGDHHSALIRFCDGLIKRQTITVHKNTYRSWIHIDNAIEIFELLLHVKGNHILNVGNPDCYPISHLAHLICDRLGIKYSNYVIETEMPERTSFVKIPDLSRQYTLTGFDKFISLEEGIDRVIKRMLCK
jgi:nucleoside-diphosphate-sugar epimerase